MKISQKTLAARLGLGLAAIVGFGLVAIEARPADAAPAKKWGQKKYRPSVNDIDGDGIPNQRDGDMDGDGIPNNRDNDADGDGIANRLDKNGFRRDGWAIRDGRWRRTQPNRDTDRDGIPNWRDRDIDGDGIPNNRDRDRNGNGVRNGRRIPNAAIIQPIDRRVIRNTVKPNNKRKPLLNPQPRRRGIGDADGDGIRNRRDRDLDGDGIRNWKDKDRDGDGTRNRRDRADRNKNRK